MDGRGEGIRALDLDLEARIIDVDVGISVADLCRINRQKSDDTYCGGEDRPLALGGNVSFLSFDME
jgi:hypothetical protein